MNIILIDIKKDRGKMSANFDLGQKKNMCVSGYPTYPIFLLPILNFTILEKFRKSVCFPEPVL
jgi:hypothetical protein